MASPNLRIVPIPLPDYFKLVRTKEVRELRRVAMEEWWVVVENGRAQVWRQF